MKTIQHHDVTVIGTGPAGISAAIALAQVGFDVALLGTEPDKQLQVGESLPGAAKRLFRRLQIDGIESLLQSDEYLDCSANLSAWASDEWTSKDAIYDPEGGGWHLLRHRFEAALLDHALTQGISHIPANAQELQASHQAYRIITKAEPDQAVLQSPWLIDATGRKAWLVRHLAGKPIQHSQQFAAIAWLGNLNDDHENTTRIKSVENGWWYSARLPQGLRVIALHGIPAEIGDIARQPGKFIRQCNDSDLLPFEVSENHLIQGLVARDAGVYASANFAGPGWLAVGDAAIAFDPLSSQGMYFAMYSGIQAAEAITDIHKTGQDMTRILQDYTHQVAEVFDSNQQTRQLFYRQEIRYPLSAYWASWRNR